MELLEHTRKAPPAVKSRTTFVEPDERAARGTLRGQIARLERDLADVLMSMTAVHVPAIAIAGTPAHGGPRLLRLGELERIRDGLELRLRHARTEVTQRVDCQEESRRLIEQMLLAPERHKYVRVTREQIGERGCGAWEVRPRYGVLGMLCGWWQVKISSGCPLGSRVVARACACHPHVEISTRHIADG